MLPSAAGKERNAQSAQLSNKSDWTHKEKAIQKAAALFTYSISQTPELAMRTKDALLVPVPPSKAKDSSEYDDRNLQLLKCFQFRADISELVLQKATRDSLHESKIRDPKKIEKNYYLNAKNIPKTIKEIWLFDDVLTQGTTFRAASNIIKTSFPQCKIVGFFIARSVYPLS